MAHRWMRVSAAALMNFVPRTAALGQSIMLSFFVYNRWVKERGGAPPAELDDGKTVWFLKDTLRNYSMGIELGYTPAECLSKAEADKTYVVQRQIVP